MSAHPYTNFLNQLKIASLQRRMSFNCIIPVRVKPLVDLLLSLNVLRRFHRVEDQIYKVYPSYTRYRRYSRPFKAYTRSDGKIRLSLKAIQILNMHTPHSYYFLETSKGLLTHKEALKHSIGGYLVLIVR